MTDDPLTRRDFAGLLASASGATLLSGSPRAVAAAQTQPATDTSWEDLQLAALLQRYPGDHLTEEMRAGILSDLRNIRRQSEALQHYTRADAEVPPLSFAAYRSDAE